MPVASLDVRFWGVRRTWLRDGRCALLTRSGSFAPSKVDSAAAERHTPLFGARLPSKRPQRRLGEHCCCPEGAQSAFEELRREQIRQAPDRAGSEPPDACVDAVGPAGKPRRGSAAATRARRSSLPENPAQHFPLRIVGWLRARPQEMIRSSSCLCCKQTYRGGSRMSALRGQSRHSLSDAVRSACDPTRTCVDFLLRRTRR